VLAGHSLEDDLAGSEGERLQSIAASKAGSIEGPLGDDDLPVAGNTRLAVWRGPALGDFEL
jgi:hypothetical protein